VLGANISIYKELKIAFDRYSENEEETEEERRNSENVPMQFISQRS
jgi:hypothetical protein